jgi:ribosomal protein S11
MWLVALGVVIAFIAAGCLPTENWGQFGFNERHTGFPSQETTITSSNVPSLAVRWSVPQNGFGTTPLVADGRLFMLGDSINAYDVLTHGRIWTQPLGSNSAAVVNGRLFVLKSSNAWPTTEPAVETILDAATGTVLKTYTFPASNFRSGVIALDGVLWFAVSAPGGGSPSVLYRQVGVDAPKLLYSSSTFDFSGDLVEFNGLVDAIGFKAGAPAVAGINSTSGKLVWTRVLPKGPNGAEWGPFHISAAYDNVYVTGVQGVAALSASSGSVRWTQTTKLCGSPCDPMPDEIVFGRVATADNRVYVQAWGGVFALKPSSGAVIWHHGTHATADASPSVANGLVYAFDSEGNLVVLSESGGAVAKTVTGWFTSLDPIIYNGQVYVNDGATGDLLVLGVT